MTKRERKPLLTILRHWACLPFLIFFYGVILLGVLGLYVFFLLGGDKESADYLKGDILWKI